MERQKSRLARRILSVKNSVGGLTHVNSFWNNKICIGLADEKKTLIDSKKFKNGNPHIEIQPD